MKYRLRETVVIKKYKKGKEDGFSCMPFRNLCEYKNKYGYFKDCMNCPIHTDKKPFIYLLNKQYINNGDYIIYYENGDREIIDKHTFRKKYIKVK
jgi:hypothetical protein